MLVLEISYYIRDCLLYVLTSKAYTFILLKCWIIPFLKMLILIDLFIHSWVRLDINPAFSPGDVHC